MAKSLHETYYKNLKTSYEISGRNYSLNENKKIKSLKHKGHNYDLIETVRWGGMITYVIKRDGKEIDQCAPNIKKDVAIKEFEKDIKAGMYD